MSKETSAQRRLRIRQARKHVEQLIERRKVALFEEAFATLARLHPNGRSMPAARWIGEAIRRG
jgi:hypothetical protein